MVIDENVEMDTKFLTRQCEGPKRKREPILPRNVHSNLQIFMDKDNY